MLGSAGEAHVERLRELANRLLTNSEVGEHPPPRGIPEGVEDRVQSWRLKFNHAVEYGQLRTIVNQLVEL